MRGCPHLGQVLVVEPEVDRDGHPPDAGLDVPLRTTKEMISPLCSPPSMSSLWFRRRSDSSKEMMP